MVGAVIVAYSFIAKELISTAEYIVGRMEGVAAVSLNCKMDAFETRKIILETIKKVDQGEGVLILTDVFEGSPSDIAFSFLNKERIEVVTGVNLPMILTFWNYRKERDLIELAEYVKLSGRRNILVARNLMEEEVTFGRIRIGGQPVSKKITKRC